MFAPGKTEVCNGTPAEYALMHRVFSMESFKQQNIYRNNILLKTYENDSCCKASL